MRESLPTTVAVFAGLLTIGCAPIQGTPTWDVDAELDGVTRPGYIACETRERFEQAVRMFGPKGDPTGLAGCYQLLGGTPVVVVDQGGRGRLMWWKFRVLDGQRPEFLYAVLGALADRPAVR